MVTTVTTTTTSITAAAASAITLITVLALLALVIQKEIFSSIGDSRARRLSNALTVAIVPLLLVFATTVVVTIYDILF